MRSWLNGTAGSIAPCQPTRSAILSLAHRIGGFPAAGRIAIKQRVNSIALAPVEEFHRDSDLFGGPPALPKRNAECKPR